MYSWAYRLYHIIVELFYANIFFIIVGRVNIKYFNKQQFILNENDYIYNNDVKCMYCSLPVSQNIYEMQVQYFVSIEN